VYDIVMSAMRIPIKTIEPPTRFRPIAEIKDIWRHRELLYLLAWRDYKIRYRQTSIGIAWAVFQPILTTLAFVLVFGHLKGIATGDIPYPLFVFSGMIIWQFFSNSITDASASLVAASQMITKIYFPRIIVPLAKIVIQLIDLVPSFFILLILMAYFRVMPMFFGFVCIVPLILILAIISAGIGVLLSAINVKYRDVQFIVPFFIQLGLFLSPVIYSATNLGKYSYLLLLNPVTGIIDSFRAALFSLTFPVAPFVVSCLFLAGLSIISLYYFSKSEGAFSDVI
jgi:lipopolysaccharide transport system permease protein